MQTVALITFLLLGSSTWGAPAKLDHLARSARHHHEGYNYEVPEEPSGLYEVPVTTTLPPPPPVDSYIPPPPAPPVDSYIPPPPAPPVDSYIPPPPAPIIDSYIPPSPSHKNINVIRPAPTKSMLMPYKFNYNVDDYESGNNYRHEVVSDGEFVEGEYSVYLPDGRTQVVKFTSSPEEGYRAEVTYI